MSTMPGISPPNATAADPELLARDLLVTSAWAMAAAARSTALISPTTDPVATINKALEHAGFSYRLRPQQ
jgi:hypothetical protein